MNNILKQYEIGVPVEFTEEAVKEIAETLNIKVNKKEFEKALGTENPYSEDNICIFYDRNDNKIFIMIDCTDNGLLDCILVRCHGAICGKVKNKMLEIDTRLRRMTPPYETLNYDLENTISDPQSAFQYMLKKLKTKKIPGMD